MSNTKLSKFMSLILRHDPEKFKLTLNKNGFVSLKDLVKVVEAEGWNENDVREVVANCDKKRFEIEGDQIRARYGHSVEEKILYPEIVPPEFLFHGTSPLVVKSIMKDGLQAMNRQYVHLSPDIKTAESVGKRHHRSPVILIVEARKARANGVKFYDASEANGLAKTYLAKTVPPEFIKIEGK